MIGENGGLNKYFSQGEFTVRWFVQTTIQVVILIISLIVFSLKIDNSIDAANTAANTATAKVEAHESLPDIHMPLSVAIKTFVPREEINTNLTAINSNLTDIKTEIIGLRNEIYRTSSGGAP